MSIIQPISKKHKKVIDDINTIVKPTNPKYPACFMRSDNVIILTCEVGSENIILDYYGEYGESLSINKNVEQYLNNNHLEYEWEDAGAIIIYV